MCNAGLKTRVTVLTCASADGFVMPPFVIYQRKNLAESLVQGEIPGTMYGMNPNSSWIDGELFQEWFTHHFLKYTPATCPLMLLLDGHTSHYNPCFIREAVSKGVIVFCLPPHTTHACQPLGMAYPQVYNVGVVSFVALDPVWKHKQYMLHKPFVCLHACLANSSTD